MNHIKVWHQIHSFKEHYEYRMYGWSIEYDEFADKYEDVLWSLNIGWPQVSFGLP